MSYLLVSWVMCLGCIWGSGQEGFFKDDGREVSIKLINYLSFTRGAGLLYSAEVTLHLAFPSLTSTACL